MPPSQFRRPPPGPPVERRAGARSGAAPRQPHHHSPGSRAVGVPARCLLVLLVAAGAQGPVARWTPELAFAVKRVGSVAISPDGRWAAVEVSDPLMEAEPSEWRASAYPYDHTGAGPQDVQVGGHVGAGMSGPAFDWSPDGAAIAFSHSPSPAGDDWVRADVSVVDVATGRTRSLVATPAAEGGAAWSPDGRWVAVTVSDTPATYALTFRVVLVSPLNGAVHPLAESFDRRPAIRGLTGEARAVVISAARGTVSRLSALPADGGAAVDLSPDTLMVSAPALNGPGTHVGFVSEAPDRAPEPYVSRLAPFAPLRVAELQSLPAIPFGKTEPIRWRSFDGREIEGLVTSPTGYRPGAPVPLLTILHGDPPSSFTHTVTGGPGAVPVPALARAGFAGAGAHGRGGSR